jgi:hypothetical protein
MMTFIRTTALPLTLLVAFSPAYGQRPHSSGPYYGGGKHTQSHGGHYQGSQNPHHKSGHYKNPRTNNQYGKHKP